MPELPDVELYVEHIARRTRGEPLLGVRFASPFLLRTVTPGTKDLVGKKVVSVFRMGKRIVLQLEEDHYVVVHLMISGRFRWGEPGAKIPGKLGMAAFDFPKGTLLMTEASTQKRAQLHFFAGKDSYRTLDPGGLEPLTATPKTFFLALTHENHTLKRSMTDPGILSGIGNAYSDEILFEAQMSPIKLTRTLTQEDATRLLSATKKVLTSWRDKLISESNAFPEKVTAFREEMTVHGRYGKPCRRCGDPVQRIVYASNEANYCARCQTDGKLLADRSLSRLLGKDFPRSLEELELRKASARAVLNDEADKVVVPKLSKSSKPPRAKRTKPT
jgi:formamidopyrimidine-DNA glycosylase